ncbi:MAG TPA: type II toxin-antitoxin system VapC family toxin [Azospirillum sp.]|nr:type II toxin-antitoxin system VapC family toxin [Azospirillum sp.]
MTRLLLDTHAVLWWLLGSDKLSQAAREAISVPASTIYVSAASGYEIIYKQGLGKLPADLPELEPALLSQRFLVLPVTLNHMTAAARLPKPHRDPWDRIIMAQALTEGLTVVTIDPVFSDYGGPVLW